MIGSISNQKYGPIIIFFGYTIFQYFWYFSKLFLIKNLIKKDEYSITNKRVLVYKGIKNELQYGNIINYHNIEIKNVRKVKDLVTKQRKELIEEKETQLQII